jgi:hypothetical protein
VSGTVDATEDLPQEAAASRVLDTYRLGNHPVYVVGTFDKGITVFSQQVRALNLAWALVSSGTLPCRDGDPDDSRTRVAVVGGGFAGLTLTAALVKKGVNATITLIERRDTLLPLQQGSDSRWLHPHIYDWPTVGSESPGAALPVMNWTASRASDVVVQALRGWSDMWRSDAHKERAAHTRIYCNARHVQVNCHDDPAPGTGAIEVEWTGELRPTGAPMNPHSSKGTAVGTSKRFDLVVLAVGFGLENEASPSYWRNETLAQPQLGQAAATYIVSGAGDGAMIDLFRLRIAQYRQDRILAELFDRSGPLVDALRAIDDNGRGGEQLNLFERLQQLWDDPVHSDATERVLRLLRKRLRNDTEVVLHVKPARFAELFDPARRVSFQNRLLAYVLFRCGGFHPSTGDVPLETLAAEYGVPDERIVLRHGTQTRQVLKEVLATELHGEVDANFALGVTPKQGDDIHWGGGYFDYIGPTPGDAIDDRKGVWRKEYLPSATEVAAAAFCASVAGYLANAHPTGKRLRVTFHRTLRIGSERVLQQCCEYVGAHPDTKRDQRAGRTFPPNHGTIGVAYELRKVVRTREGATWETINEDMKQLRLNDASRQMADEVQSVVAIPVIGAAETTADGEGRETVVGVLYADSYEQDYFTEAVTMTTLVDMTQRFARELTELASTAAGRVANFAYWGGQSADEPSLPADFSDLQAIEAMTLPVPAGPMLTQINFDFSDFEQVRV